MRDYYMSHRISLRELARRSKSLFGVDFTYDDLRVYSTRGKWSGLKSGGDGENMDDIGNEVNTIRRVLFRQIVAMSENGLVVHGGTEDLGELVAELKGRGYDVELFSPSGLEASLVNSYMNLLQKANFDLGHSTSKKTSQQRVLELLRGDDG